MALKYQGFPKHQTPAERADRALRLAMTGKEYAAWRKERQEYYRDLLKKVQESK